jgi:hypothetical protein
MAICPQCGLYHGASHSLYPGCAKDDHQLHRDDSSGNNACESADLNESSSGLDGIGENGAGDDGVDGVAIARFQSGAEAGYFADELTRQTGIEADVLVRERFDAVHAVWTVDYILMVSAFHAQEAPQALQSLVDATGDDVGEESTGRSVSDLPAGVWVPLILTLAAGSIACFGIDHLDQRPRPAALVVGDGRKPPELWEILGATNGPWVQQLEGGRGTRKLTLNPDERTAVLEEDHDGDGHVDREWEFSWHAK